MEKIIIRCSADYLQYTFPARKWYQFGRQNRIALMRLAFADNDVLETDIGLEVYEDFCEDTIRFVEDSFWEELYEAMLKQYQKDYRNAEHLIVLDSDRCDLTELLYDLAENRNYLSIQTDNPGKYETVAERIEADYGLVAMFFEDEKELLRYVKQMPEKKSTLMIAGENNKEDSKGLKWQKTDKWRTSLLCALPEKSFFMDFSLNGIYNNLILKKRLKITYASIPIFLDNTVKNRYNAVVNEGITFQVKKDKKTVWRRKGNEDGRKEKYPDI